MTRLPARSSERRAHALGPAIFAALQLAACLKPNPLALAGDDASEASESESEAESSDATTSDGETDGATTSSEASSESSEASSEGSEATTDAPTDLPTDTQGDCSAPPEFAPECASCLIQTCCTSLVPCAEDVVCVCLADCLFAGGSNNECRMLCGEKPADVEPLAPLMSCASRDCPICKS